MEQEAFMNLVEQRLTDIFDRYQQGLDVPPATVFRTEGLLEAAVHLNFVSQDGAKLLIGKSYRQCFNCDLTELGDGLHIPVQMTRAPVYPSKK
jgi:hypothetical protein